MREERTALDTGPGIKLKIAAPLSVRTPPKPPATVQVGSGNDCTRLVADGQISESKLGGCRYPTLASFSDGCPLCLGT